MNFIDHNKSDVSLWDMWLSHYTFPILSFLDEIRFFDQVASKPLSLVNLKNHFDLSDRSIEILVSFSCSLRFLNLDGQIYSTTPLANRYLVSTSPEYWGGMFSGWRRYDIFNEIKQAMSGSSHSTLHTERWKSGEVTSGATEIFLKAMQSHSLMGARFLGEQGLFDQTRSLLDVGGGSGCFSIEALNANPEASATIQELPEVVSETLKFVKKSNVKDRINVIGLDMFKEQWPQGHDTIFLSNILHDWKYQDCVRILSKAFESIEKGGVLLVHEIMMDDDFTGPLAASVFSLIMLLRTEGRQWTRAELTRMAEEAGFSEISIKPGLHHFSILRAVKL